MVDDDFLQNLQRLSQYFYFFELFLNQQFFDVFVCISVVGVEFNCAEVVYECLFVLTFIRECLTKVVISDCKFRVDFDGAVVAADRLIVSF